MSYINNRGGWPELAPEIKTTEAENPNAIVKGLKQIGSFLGRLTLDHRDIELREARQKFYDDIEYFSEHGVFPDETPAESDRPNPNIN